MRDFGGGGNVIMNVRPMYFFRQCYKVCRVFVLDVFLAALMSS
jgi:hypothetical protein